jgi:hypothetical protein
MKSLATRKITPNNPLPLRFRFAKRSEDGALGGRCARNSNKNENFLAFDAQCAYFTM